MTDSNERESIEVLAASVVHAYRHDGPGDIALALRALAEAVGPEPVPIDMVLHCPKCRLQHVDAPEHEREGEIYDGDQVSDSVITGWQNPPHRSHLCHGCGHVWRPADVPTNGVQAVKTRGCHDSPPAP